MTDVPDFFTVVEAARILRLSRSTMYRLVRLYLETGGRKGIPVVVLGGQHRIARSTLEELAGGPVHLPEVAVAAPVVELDGLRPVERRPAEGEEAPASSRVGLGV